MGQRGLLQMRFKRRSMKNMRLSLIVSSLILATLVIVRNPVPLVHAASSSTGPCAVNGCDNTYVNPPCSLSGNSYEKGPSTSFLAQVSGDTSTPDCANSSQALGSG